MKWPAELARVRVCRVELQPAGQKSNTPTFLKVSTRTGITSAPNGTDAIPTCPAAITHLFLKAANSNGVWNETPCPHRGEGHSARSGRRYGSASCRGLSRLPWWRWASACAQRRSRTATVNWSGLSANGPARSKSAVRRSRRSIKPMNRSCATSACNQVFQTLVDVAVDILNADRSVVFAWDEKHTKVVAASQPTGSRPETLKVMEFAEGEGVMGGVLEAGKPAIVRQIEIERFSPGDPRCAHRGGHPFVCPPPDHGGRTRLSACSTSVLPSRT
ncbi:MAG: hypothetical protein MZV64_23420 [Ignavibacteriales bacterium]|nr:hypothetical protein [Ignavibacteriales bacterium]